MAKFALTDIPPLSEKTPAGVEKWLLALYEKDMLWHMDDSPLNVPNFAGIDRALRALQQEAWRICPELWQLPVWKEIFKRMDMEAAA